MKVREFKVDNFATMFREVANLVSPECPLVIIERTDVGGHPWCYLAINEERAGVVASTLKKWQVAHPKTFTPGVIWFVSSNPKKEVMKELQKVFGEEIELEYI